MNMLPGTLSGGSLSVAGQSVPASRWAGSGSDQEVTVGVRPEYVRLGGEGPLCVDGEVEIVENLGATMLVTVRAQDGSRLQAVVPEGTEPSVGESVPAVPLAERVLVYGEDGELLAS